MLCANLVFTVFSCSSGHRGHVLSLEPRIRNNIMQEYLTCFAYWKLRVHSEGLISWGQLVCSANRNACTLFPALKTGCFSSKCMAISRHSSINPRQLMWSQPHLPTLADAPAFVQPHNHTMHTFNVLAYHTWRSQGPACTAYEAYTAFDQPPLSSVTVFNFSMPKSCSHFFFLTDSSTSG